MDLRQLLQTIATTYDRKAGLSSSSQGLLRTASVELEAIVPGGLTVKFSGGRGTATFTPWLAVLDPDETESPQEGIYVVYLFSSDMRSLNLTLIQGVTQILRKFGQREGRKRLAAESSAIYEGLPDDQVKDLVRNINLGVGGFRQAGYESGTIAAKVYQLPSLRSDQEMRSDLLRFLSLYQTAIEVKRNLLQSRPGVVVSPSVQRSGALKDPLQYFKPNDSTDYVSHIQGRKMVKSRRHEKLIEEYGRWIKKNGYDPSNHEFPRDLVLRDKSDQWLVEVKILYRGNATEAVRAAVGQLFTYRHFLYPGESRPRLVALFSEPIGQAYVGFLEGLGIESIWKVENGWGGSDQAKASKLCT